MTFTLKLTVNDTPVATDRFVASFIDHVVGGMVASLPGTSEVRELYLTIGGGNVSLNLNGAMVPTSAFVKKAVKGTIEGLVGTLKGVGTVKQLSITIRRSGPCHL